MTPEEIRTAYRSALLALFKTSPNTRACLAASKECARLYDLAPEVCDAVEEELAKN